MVENNKVFLSASLEHIRDRHAALQKEKNLTLALFQYKKKQQQQRDPRSFLSLPPFTHLS